MSTPLPFFLGNRSEYLAIPALAKLGFTVPVPRQEDRFGIDFIIHLARLEDQTILPTGKSFGIQIKSNDDSLVFKKQHERDCLYNSSLPLFLGVVSRNNLTLRLYNTLNRINCFWLYGDKRNLSLVFGGRGSGVPKPDYDQEKNHCFAYTGKPILEIKLAEPEKSEDRSAEIETLQSTIKSWIELENLNLSLKEQGIGLFYFPATYSINKPLSHDFVYSTTKYASWDTFPNICTATKRTITSFSFYLRKMPGETLNKTIQFLMDSSLSHVQELERYCEDLLKEMYSST